MLLPGWLNPELFREAMCHHQRVYCVSLHRKGLQGEMFLLINPVSR